MVSWRVCRCLLTRREVRSESGITVAHLRCRRLAREDFSRSDDRVLLSVVYATLAFRFHKPLCQQAPPSAF